MTRRKLVSAAAAGVAVPAAAAPSTRQMLVLRTYQLRNSPANMGQRTVQYFEKSLMPAMKRAGAEGMGFFTSFLGPDTPFYLTLEGYPSLAAAETAMGKMDADKEFQSALSSFNKGEGLRFVRYRTQVLRSFEKWPAIVTPQNSSRGPRLFELRTYESNDTSSLAQKIRMFNEGEIGVFEKTGLAPVFFGETVFGDKQPNLTYMLWYDDLTAREENWKKFLAHPDWAKLKATPGWSDAEIVSNISASFLRPLPFSPIR